RPGLPPAWRPLPTPGADQLRAGAPAEPSAAATAARPPGDRCTTEHCVLGVALRENAELATVDHALAEAARRLRVTVLPGSSPG
ncbi:MAG TPA: hypothetical protein PKB06_12580, partial [Actinotalea sp.]|nr:hypothetical protein [Actinotalea sp.]